MLAAGRTGPIILVATQGDYAQSLAERVQLAEHHYFPLANALLSRVACVDRQPRPVWDGELNTVGGSGL